MQRRPGIKETGKKLEAKKAMQSYQDDYFSQVSVQCGHTRLGPRRQRLTRAEWKGQQEYAMKIAAAESAVLDSAATACGAASKEKRATREAMQKALALQAEAGKNRAI